MTRPPTTPLVRGRPDARGVALEALCRFLSRGEYVSTSLEQLVETAHLSAVDRGLAWELATGVVRRRSTLHAILAPYLDRPFDQLDPPISESLLLGIHQLLFLDRIPPHAAVHETVELCHRTGLGRAAGFVNGVLRAVLRDVPPADQPLSLLSQLQHADRFTIPRCQLLHGELHMESIRWPRAIHADPRTQPLDWLSTAFSLPLWLIERWQQRLSLEDLFHQVAWFATPGRMMLRVNLLRTTRDTLLTRLQEQGLAARPGNLAECILLEDAVDVRRLPGFLEGWYSIQDASAMSAVDLLAPRPGEQILDLCAAPGGKTMFLAERLKDSGAVVACDISAERLRLLDESAARLGLTCITSQIVSPTGDDLPAGPFDAALVDAPCSNTGVLGKRPEARWRIDTTSLQELAELQRQLLGHALYRVRAGGRVVYSTCSIEPEENGDVVRDILAQHPHWELLKELHHVPGQPGDGAYQALLVSRLEPIG